MHGHHEELTIEILKTYPGFENYSDEEAAIILSQLREFCLIILETASDEDN